MIRNALATCLVVLLLILDQPLQAQFSLHITAEVPPGTREAYLSGNFNNWNFSDQNYQLTKIDDRRMSIHLVLKAGIYKFKFTRGTTATWECGAFGTRSPDHVLNIAADTSIAVVVAAWSDAYFELRNLPDSLRYEAMMNRAGYFVEQNLDSSTKYAEGLYEASLHLSPMKQARALDLQATVYTKQGNGEKALPLWFKSLEIKRTYPDSSGIGFVYTGIGIIYESVADDEKAKENYLQANLWQSERFVEYKSVPLTKIALIFYRSQNLDSALWYANKAIKCDSTSMETLLLLGDIAEKKGNDIRALRYFQLAALAGNHKSPGSPLFTNSVEAYKKMGSIYYTLKQYDSAFFYGRKSFAMASLLDNPYYISSASAGMATLFEKEKEFDSAYFYQKIVLQKNDSLFTSDKKRQVQTIYTNERIRQQELLA